MGRWGEWETLIPPSMWINFFLFYCILKEAERLAEEERLRLEEEEQRRAEEEQLRLLEEARLAEEMRLQQAIEVSCLLFYYLFGSN